MSTTQSGGRVSTAKSSVGMIDRLGAKLESPAATYYLLVAVTSLLVVFGLVMVLSASMVESLAATKDGSPFSIFAKQLVFAALGTIALIVSSRISVKQWRRLAWPILGAAMILQILVFTALGDEVLGNRNWIRLGPVSMQPSELLKVGLVLVGALVMDIKREKVGELVHAVVPYVFPIAFIALSLVMAGSDLGTVIILAAIVAGVLYTAGVPGRWFAAVGGVGVLAAVALVISAPHRLDRFNVWLGRDTNEWGNARQPLHGRYALADGGWIGLGLGGSREKWQLLSEPHNDFIFAIIGEELGLPGTLVVLALFAVLAYACYRIVARTRDVFVRVATAGIMAWVISQALVNIGSVIGALPVIGVPLPLVSSGGSSLVTTLMALGILMSFARSEPGCAQLLAGRGVALRRGAAVVSARSVSEVRRKNTRLGRKKTP